MPRTLVLSGPLLASSRKQQLIRFLRMAPCRFQHVRTVYKEASTVLVVPHSTVVVAEFQVHAEKGPAEDGLRD